MTNTAAYCKSNKENNSPARISVNQKFNSSSLTGLNPRGGINGCLSNSLCTQLDSAKANQSNEEGDVPHPVQLSTLNIENMRDFPESIPKIRDFFVFYTTHKL